MLIINRMKETTNIHFLSQKIQNKNKKSFTSAFSLPLHPLNIADEATGKRIKKFRIFAI